MMQRLVARFRNLFVIVCLSAVAACATDSGSVTDAQIASLLTDYEAQSAQIAAERAESIDASILYLKITSRSDGMGYLVSADLIDAPVDIVVERILIDSGITYDLSDIRLGGRTTAKFEGVPLEIVINRLLNPRGVSAEWKDGVLVFRRGVRAQPKVAKKGDGDDDGEATKIYEVVPLRHLAVSDATALLKGLYNFEKDDDPAITIGELAGKNAIYIGGAPSDVANSVAVLYQADQEIPHVLIEALVVELDVLAIENIGTELSNLGLGDLKDGSLKPDRLAQNVIFSILRGAGTAAQLTATIDLLVSLDKAQVLSRPYMATRSNEAAQIKVVTERFVQIESNENGVDFSTDAIEAGVTFDITPTVLADDTIRMDVQVEESQFENEVAGALAQTGSSSAKTSMSVASGQTIVVGGLNRRRLEVGNAGIPGFRRVPILKFLFASQTGLERTSEVVVYITPYVWSPSMGTPLPSPGTPMVHRTDLGRNERQVEGIR